MGRLTNEAGRDLYSYLAHIGAPSSKMAAMVVLHDKQKNTYFRGVADYAGDDNRHVEHILMALISEHYKDKLSDVPNNAKIVFFCTWSPCTKCTRDHLPGFAKILGAKERAISLKFVFQEYYVKGKFTPSSHQHAGTSLWESQEAANAAYAALMAESGTIFEPKAHNEIGNTVVGKVIPVIQVKQVGSGKLSSTVELPLT